MSRCLPYFVSIPQWRAIARAGKRKRELTLPSSLLASDALVSPNSDRENSPLTSPSAVASLADIARLLKRVHPYG